MGSLPPGPGQYAQGFVGLNTFIYEPVGYDIDNQISVAGTLQAESIKDPTAGGGKSNSSVGQNHIGNATGNKPDVRQLLYYKNHLFSHELANTASFFHSLMLHRHGPYGFPMWKQMRIGHNPLTRRQNKENVFTIVMEPGEEIRRQYKDGVEVLVNRYGVIRRFDEVPITSRFKPFSFVGGTTIIDPRTKNNMLKRFDIQATLANETCFFNNDELNRIYNRTSCENENYSLIRDMYLDDALNDDCSPVDSFELFKYRETIYPPQIYTYKSYTRERTTFAFPWNTDRLTRNKQGVDAGGKNIASGLYNYVITASCWPLDVESDYLTRADIDPFHCKVGSPTLDDAGLLARGYSQFYLTAQGTGYACVDATAYYSRRQTLDSTASVVSPDGIDVPATGTTSATFVSNQLHLGSPLWEAATQAGKYPFQNSYADFAQQLRLRGQGYSIVPEYRESSLVEEMYASGALSVTGGLFSLTGGLRDQNSDANEDFFTIYTNSDFLKHFDLVREQHKDFTEPSSITLKCNAVKKFVPYEGFYPAQRCDQIAQQFYDSYHKGVLIGEVLAGFDMSQSPTGSYVDNVNSATDSVRATAVRAMQAFLTPTLAPGILFNTIKAGVACDWPQVTASINPIDGSILLAGPMGGTFAITNALIGQTFKTRFPFEALIEPRKYLANQALFATEPGFDSASYAVWDGKGDLYYELMMNNFLAEVPEFFLENKNFTYLYSKKQSDPSFGQAEAGKKYAMRVKMRKTLSGPAKNPTANGFPYPTPQTIPSDNAKENFTMYSRPTAFGPPSIGGGTVSTSQSVDCYNSKEYGSEYGYNFPFTPPYYHGEAWADITFSCEETKKYSLSEIIDSSSVQYYRWFDPQIHADASGSFSSGMPSIPPSILYGPQSPYQVNSNAMQLNSSVNLFSNGIIDVTDSLKLSATDDPDARWIIQSKFETPMLNFKDVAITNPVAGSGSVAKGMWHQYGRLPTSDEGVFLQAGDIPHNFLGAIGLNPVQIAATGSLLDLVGFTNQEARMGEIATKKKVKEAVVAVPFVEQDGQRKYFKMPRKDLEYALDAIADPLSQDKRGKIGDSVFKMVTKMKQYNFPPVMNFVDFDEVDPFYMYIFEFEHEFTTLDLADMWQNLPPTLNETMETAEATISHPLLAQEILGGGVIERQSPGGGGMITLRDVKGKDLPDKIKWMVFKVKQKAKKRYFEKIVGKRESLQVSQNKSLEGVGYGPTGKNVKFGYNWPYDFFSMVELVKIDAEITLSDVDTETETIKPKTGKNVPPKVTEKFEELNKSVKKGRRK